MRSAVRSGYVQAAALIANEQSIIQMMSLLNFSDEDERHSRPKFSSPI